MIPRLIDKVSVSMVNSVVSNKPKKPKKNPQSIYDDQDRDYSSKPDQVVRFTACAPPLRFTKAERLIDSFTHELRGLWTGGTGREQVWDPVSRL